jgi:hypothetical protein
MNRGETEALKLWWNDGDGEGKSKVGVGDVRAGGVFFAGG